MKLLDLGVHELLKVYVKFKKIPQNPTYTSNRNKIVNSLILLPQEMLEKVNSPSFFGTSQFITSF